MNSFKACGTSDFKVFMFQRLDDVTFLAGLGANVATQLAQYAKTPQPPIYQSLLAM